MTSAASLPTDTVMPTALATGNKVVLLSSHPAAASQGHGDAAALALGLQGSPLPRGHVRRLRDIYRSAGWPRCDGLEIELLAAGLLLRQQDEQGRDTVRLSDAGIRCLADSRQGNRVAHSAHEALVEQVAQLMQRDGRLVWQGLSLRADVEQGRPAPDAGPMLPALDAEAQAPGSDWIDGLGPAQVARQPSQWKLCRPDVFSIRSTSLPAYLDPVVHEIKVSRADLLSDLKKADKRAAYLALGGQCWYVLGQDARGRTIAEPNEVPLACGVLVQQGTRLVVARMAPRRAATGLPFHVWMALARSSPKPMTDGEDSVAQPDLIAADAHQISAG